METNETNLEGQVDHEGKLLRFARRHPAISVIGAAGIGLFGGIELAAGMLLGATVAALLRPGETEAIKASVREKAQNIAERAPHDLKERARAVVQAARGKIAPTDEPVEEVSGAEEPV